MKMYHTPGGTNRGDTHIQHHQHFQNVGDNDVVIIRRDSMDNGIPFNATTTHQSAYVKHNLEQRRPPPPPPPRQDANPPKFQGRSCYSGDYVEHPLDRREKKGQPSPRWEPNDIPMNARSTYTENYPWHPTQPRSAAGPRTPGATMDSNPPPFHGQSSYKIDYIKHQMDRPKTDSGPRREKRMEESPPFNGTTTYTTDFKKHAHSAQQRGGPGVRKQESGPSPPFQGNSEYQNEYIKKERARVPIVHLEPEDKASRDARKRAERS